jgi:hypothetical protein
MTLKNILTISGIVNRPRTPKLWAMAQETCITHENDEFLVESLKYVQGLTSLINRPELQNCGQYYVSRLLIVELA